MTVRTAALAGLAAAILAGCSSTPPQKSDPVAVSGVVLLPSGTPAKDVTLCFYPTSSSQTQMYVDLKTDGKFQTTLVPGQYTYGFEGKPGPMKAIPTGYHSNDAAHAVEVPSAGAPDLTIRLQ